MKKLTFEQEIAFTQLSNIIDKANSFDKMKKLCQLYVKHYVIVRSELSNKQTIFNKMAKDLVALESLLLEVQSEIEKRQKEAS